MGWNPVKAVTQAISNVVSGATQAVKAVVQPVYNATLKNIPGVDNALVNLDKSVGKAIPGGWGTVASIAASFIPGGQLATMSNGLLTPTRLAVGLGALSGSGVMRGKHDFNLQGAIMGGAMAYGASQLAQGFQNAADPATTSATKAIEDVAKAETSNIASNLGVEGAQTGAGSQARMLAEQNAGFGQEGLKSINSASNQAIQSNLASTGLSNAVSNPDVFSGLAGTQQAIAQPTGLQSLGTNLADAGKGTLSNMADAGKGVANLTGFGPEGISGISKAATAFTDPITTGGVASGIMGYSGMAALEERQKQLDEQLAAGNIAQDQYDKEKASIAEQVKTANEAVSANPLHAYTDTNSVSQGPTLYAGRSTEDTLYDKNPRGGSSLLYAMGGTVDSPDDQTGIPNESPVNFGLGGIMGYATGGMPPRFLSGGGDGMSDSIKANIGGTQEARLADGEFVIPADVVSHMGNGSSKAGAKQLYSMMDKVRKARTGRKSQGKQINPRKYMPV